jgi:alkylation response protein AidB-like acyl-CoA dehydrogenase
LTLFYTDLDRTQVEVKEIPKMGRGAVDSNTLFFDTWRVPVEDRIGEERNGFKMVMHGMNAERILIAAYALGTGFARAKACGSVCGRAEGIWEGHWPESGDSTSAGG